LTADRISEIFGLRLNKRLRGKLATVIEQIEYGHHVFCVYWKHSFVKQYEKFSRLDSSVSMFCVTAMNRTPAQLLECF
jgi:hypothetical protein